MHGGAPIGALVELDITRALCLLPDELDDEQHHQGLGLRLERCASDAVRRRVASMEGDDDGDGDEGASLPTSAVQALLRRTLPP